MFLYECVNPFGERRPSGLPGVSRGKCQSILECIELGLSRPVKQLSVPR